MRIQNLFIFATLALAYSFVASSFADVVIEGMVASPKNKAAQKFTGFFSSSGFRYEMVGGKSGSPSVFIFRENPKVFWVVDRDQKSFYEMTEKDLEKAVGLAKSAAGLLDALPESQRKMMEKYMDKKQLQQLQNARKQKADAKEKMSFKKTSKKGQVRKWKCTWFDGFRGSKKVSEHCVASFSEAGVKKSDFKAAFSAQSMIEKATQGLPGAGEYGQFNFVDTLGGLPVLTRSFNQNKLESRVEISSISKSTSVPSSKYQPPKGAKKKSIGSLVSGGKK